MELCYMYKEVNYIQGINRGSLMIFTVKSAFRNFNNIHLSYTADKRHHTPSMSCGVLIIKETIHLITMVLAYLMPVAL